MCGAATQQPALEPQDVLAGNVDPVIDALTMHYQLEQLAAG